MLPVPVSTRPDVDSVSVPWWWIGITFLLSVSLWGGETDRWSRQGEERGPIWGVDAGGEEGEVQAT